jgi:hypothetical protein
MTRAVYSDIFYFLWNNIHLNVERTVQNSISTFCKVADQLMKDIFSLVFNYWYL